MEFHNITVHAVLTCKENDKAVDIAKKLKENKERRIFVVDDSSKLKGVVTTTDLVYKAFEKKDVVAKDIMTKNVKHVDVKEDIEKALEIMNEIKSFVCPLTEDGKVLGVVSHHDILSHVLGSLE